jgi:hypothetical protein
MVVQNRPTCDIAWVGLLVLQANGEFGQSKQILFNATHAMQ